MQIRPRTAACENSTVAYGNGADPRKTTSVVKNEYFAPTNLLRKRNIATPPSAVIKPTDPTVVIQLETSQPCGESSGIPNTRRRLTDAANAGTARTIIPGALSL